MSLIGRLSCDRLGLPEALLVILNEERWAELRRFRALHASGAMSVSEIARETGLHRQTVRKYLSSQAPPGPPRGSSRQGTQDHRKAPLASVEPLTPQVPHGARPCPWPRRPVLWGPVP